MADPLSSPLRSCEAGSFQDSTSPAVPSTQLMLLDWFFPGFSVFAGLVQKNLRIDLNVYIPLLASAGLLMLCWNYVSQYVRDRVEIYFMSVVDIRVDDEIYNILMAWVATQKFSQGARKFVVNTSLSSRSWNIWRWDDDDDDDGDDAGEENASKKKKALLYTPSFGSHYFWYRGRLLLFRRKANREQSALMAVSEREEISISCFGRNPWILKELLLEAREQYLLRDKHKTQIYRGTTKALSNRPSWQRCMSRASRPFSTVILGEKMKNELIDDVSDYLNPATQRWYANRGIPYRRGYLLHGPPGTGKSSLSLALAGFFNMRIYIVSLNSVNATEETLGGLFSELPRRCIVLLEDIDTAGLAHTREENGSPAQISPGDAAGMEPGHATPDTARNNKDNSNSRLSLSGLLNILDGVASQEGRILIMTTNHVEKLDKALIRPGRVDMVVEFGLADKYMSINMFRNIFAHLEGDDGPDATRDIYLSSDERQAAKDKKAKERAAHDARIHELAEAFADKIPDHEFSPAELQGHLTKHKRSPETAVATAEEFVEKTRQSHKEKELKAAEAKRKAERAKAAERKKQVDDEKEKARQKEEEEIKKKVEEAIQKEFGEEIRKKVEAEIKKKEAESEVKKPLEQDVTKPNDVSGSNTMTEQTDTHSGVRVATIVDAKPGLNIPGTETVAKEMPHVNENEKGSTQPDSGYATPSSGEP